MCSNKLYIASEGRGMARFVRRSDNEPLMRLERPSCASSQTTAHIINACFNDILSQTPLDHGTVSNLAVSKRGESSYHDEFVENLQEVSDEYNQRLKKLAHLENHIIQARAKALAEDEKVVSGLAKICPSFQEIGLPRGPSTLHKLLNDDLLLENHLLAPSQYYPLPPSPKQPPTTDGPPSYMQPTYTSTQHTAVKTGNLETTAKHLITPTWKNTLIPVEREADKIALAKLEHRSVYLQNPKYSHSALTNTASSGPLKLRQQQQEISDEKYVSRVTQFFVAEPSEIRFNDYQPGHSYEAVVKLKNISGASRQLRIVPLNSSFFTVTPDQFPNTDGLIAPGMCCSYTVRFTPDSLANYEDELKVLTNNGGCLGIPIRAVRPAPELSLPRVLECKCCLAGDRTTSTIECRNLGGEGMFRIISDHQQGDTKCNQSPGSLSLGPFNISPTEFHMPAGSDMTFSVDFEPNHIGEHLEYFTMACDNGQVLSFTLRGVAGKVEVGCVSIGEGLSHEVASSPVNYLLDEDDPVINEGLVNTIEYPQIEFTSINPHNATHSTVIIKNFSEVDLPFHWSSYRPITRSAEGNLENQDAPLVDKLVLSTHKAFSVQPNNGVLYAGEAKRFSFKFHPEKVGSFTDMAHLVLSGIQTDLGLDPSQEGLRWLRLSETEVSVVYVEMTGTSLAYNVELKPSAVLFPGELTIASETRKRIKIHNHSLSDVGYHWDGYEGDEVSVSMEPAYGSVASGSSVHCELIIETHSMGPFAINLQCHLDQCDSTFNLPIEGCVQAPAVKTSIANLNYGLIQLGQSSSLKFSISNFSNCPVDCQIRQVVVNETDHHCLSVTNGFGDKFRLEAFGSTNLTVACHPKRLGQINSVLELLVNESPYKHIAVLAEAQEPQVHLERCELHLDKEYLGIASSHTVTLKNSGLLSTQFTWSSQMSGASIEHCRVKVTPMTGRIGPRDEVTIILETTWDEIGSHPESVLRCDILGARTPLFLHLSADVYGLSVSYEVQRLKKISDSSDSLSDEDQCRDLTLDYGCHPLGVPVELTVTVTNTTAIPTSLKAHITNFPAAKPPTPPTQPNKGESIHAKRGKYLLQRTVNVGDPKSKSPQQAATDYAGSLLREGRGACFLVTPSTTDLPPFSSVSLIVTAYSNMWGQYTDQLVCKVTDCDSKVMPISYGVTGCPVVFQATATPAQTLVRFGSHLPNSKVIKRVLKLKNTSPVDLRVDWTMSNILLDDNKIVDLVTFIDTPFPKLDTFMTSNSGSVTTLHTTTSHREGGLSSITNSTENCDERNTEDSSLCHLIGVLIKPHEGVPSNHPFDITPKQMVIPAHSYCSVTVTFEPSITALNDMGDALASYAQGYFSLDQEDPPNVIRSSGYDVEPLRVDILASIEHAKLTLDCDEDDGLTFNLPASSLINSDEWAQVQESVQVCHGFTLINSNSSLLQFTCTTSTPLFNITNVSTMNEYKDYIVLKSQHNVTFGVTFTLTLDKLKTEESLTSKRTITFDDTLEVEFITGAKQVFPLRAVVILPKLDISKNTINFGTCLLNKAVSTNVALSNDTGCAVQWIGTVSQELQDVVCLDGDSGLLPPYLTDGKPSTHLLQVTFIPRNEASYQGLITLQEQLTNKQLTITVTGSGSADEQYCSQFNQH